MTYYKTVKVVEVDYTSLTLEYYRKRREIIEPVLKEFFKDEDTGKVPDISYAFGPNDELIADLTMVKDELTGEREFAHLWTQYWDEVMDYVIYGTFTGYLYWLGGTWIDYPWALYEKTDAQQAMYALDAEFTAACEELRNSLIQPYWDERLEWGEREDKVYRFEREKDRLYADIIECQKRIMEYENQKEKYETELEKIKAEEEN